MIRAIILKRYPQKKNPKGKQLDVFSAYLSQYTYCSDQTWYYAY